MIFLPEGSVALPERDWSVLQEPWEAVTLCHVRRLEGLERMGKRLLPSPVRGDGDLILCGGCRGG